MKLGIRQKLLAMAVAVLILPSTFFAYVTVEISNTESIAIEKEQQIAAHFRTTREANAHFNSMRYWLTDLAVTWLNESEDNAADSYDQLQVTLDILAASDPEIVDELRPMFDEYQDLMLQAVDAYVDDNRVLGNSIVSNSLPVAASIEAMLMPLVANDEAAAEATLLDLAEGNAALVFKAFIGLGASFLLSIALSWWISGAITKPIRESVGIAERVARGELNNHIEVRSKDESGQLLMALDQMQNSLTEVVGEIERASLSVKSGADEITQGNADLSQRSEEQASSLEETAASMEEMTSTVKQNADNASEANQLAMAAREQAEKGGAVVSQAVKAMNEINDSSKKISDIIGVIDEIAFQTNLLALNASVEAARAGDQGRGFAVVASEVRNLAGRSATAAKEIKELIVDSASKVDEGSRLVNESGATLEEIVNGVKKVTDIVGEIAAASKEQAAGIDEVNRAIVQMDEMTQQNAAMVEQAAAAAESLGEQADDLNEMIGFFTIEDGTMESMVNTKSPAASAERRTADRPWTGPKTAETSEPVATPAPQMKKAAVGDDDEEWEEF